MSSEPNSQLTAERPDIWDRAVTLATSVEPQPRRESERQIRCHSPLCSFTYSPPDCEMCGGTGWHFCNCQNETWRIINQKWRKVADDPSLLTKEEADLVIGAIPLNALPRQEKCEHAISLTEDYVGLTKDCPIHGVQAIRNHPRRLRATESETALSRAGG